MRIIIAIVSCERDRSTHYAIRQTWARNWAFSDAPGVQVDYKFFLGRPTLPVEADEVALDAGDSYEEVTDKALRTFEWALERGYDFMLHVGRDTYVDVPRLIAAVEELQEYDYAGHCGYCDIDAMTSELIPDGKGRYPYASGGGGSWLSARAMKVILDSPIRHEADDLMFGWALGAAGYPCRHDLRFQKRGNCVGQRGLTVHLSQGTGCYQPQWMIDCHNRSKQFRRWNP